MIPRFKISFVFEASNVLEKKKNKTWVALCFLQKWLANSTFHVSQIFHKYFIEVNEEGIEVEAS